MNKKKIIVFAPHPDDETLGCGGSIAKKTREGYEVFVVVITDGRYLFLKTLNIDSDPSPEEVKEIRKEEVKRATEILGLPQENLLFLDFVDGTLEKCEEDLEEKISEILSKNSPAEIYFPSEKDFHPDHRATNRVVRNAVKKLGLTVPRYKYSIMQTNSRIGPLMDSLFNLIRPTLLYVDIKEFLPLKELAIKEFKSEIDVISDKQKKPLTESVKKYLKNAETFYIDK